MRLRSEAMGRRATKKKCKNEAESGRLRVRGFSSVRPASRLAAADGRRSMKAPPAVPKNRRRPVCPESAIAKKTGPAG
jgi:hypothetical protein